MGENEILIVVLSAVLRTQEKADLIERLRATEGIEFVRTTDGIVQDVLEAQFSRNRKELD